MMWKNITPDMHLDDFGAYIIQIHIQWLRVEDIINLDVKKYYLSVTW